MIASLELKTPQNAERGIETGIPFEVDARISNGKRALLRQSALTVRRQLDDVPRYEDASPATKMVSANRTSGPQVWRAQIARHQCGMRSAQND